MRLITASYPWTEPPQELIGGLPSVLLGLKPSEVEFGDFIAGLMAGAPVPGADHRGRPAHRFDLLNPMFPSTAPSCRLSGATPAPGPTEDQGCPKAGREGLT